MKIKINPVKVVMQFSKAVDRHIGLKLNAQKIYPESETLEVIPSHEKQIFNGLYKDVVVKPLPEEYVIPEVVGETLVLSRGNVERGVLSL